jgi:Sugar (and other) transporter
VLGITMLFWLFDGYETFALLLTIGPSLHDLLPPAALATLPRIAAYLISITLFGWAVGGVVGFWAISSWVPTYAATFAPNPRTGVYYASWAGLLYTIGEMLGCIGFGMLAEAWGRRGTLVFYLAGSVLITPIVFLLISDASIVILLQLANGFLTGGLYGWYAVHPPEIFPTSIRSTDQPDFQFGAVSCHVWSDRGVRVDRLLRWLRAGGDHVGKCLCCRYFAVLFLPETKGKPLPA